MTAKKPAVANDPLATTVRVTDRGEFSNLDVAQANDAAVREIIDEHGYPVSGTILSAFSRKENAAPSA
jgi:hypothetical protein